MSILTAAPSGFAYVPELITAEEERTLLSWLAASHEWRDVVFRGQRALRRALSFGARYLTQGRSLSPAPPLPTELAGYRDRMVEAAVARLGPELALAGRTTADFSLCTALQYPQGAAIGWHADNAKFGPTVLSLSMGASARLQLSPASGEGLAAAPRFELGLAPRSLFVLAGEARAAWLHRLLPVRAPRHSFTVRASATVA
jgi:alkylated DNA repair dioxygenase AlkB